MTATVTSTNNYINNVISNATTNCMNSKLLSNQILNVGNGNLYSNIVQNATGGYTMGCLAYPSNTATFLNNISQSQTTNYSSDMSNDNVNGTVNTTIANYLANNINVPSVDTCLTQLNEINKIQDYGNSNIFNTITQNAIANISVECINNSNNNINGNNDMTDAINTSVTAKESSYEPLGVMFDNFIIVLFILACIMMVVFTSYVIYGTRFRVEK